MPTEVTIEGAQRLSGLTNVLPVKKSSGLEKSPAVRQELPTESRPLPLLEAGSELSKNVDSIEKEIEGLNTKVQNLSRDLQFSVDADSGRTIIRVIDSETRETIRTIPPEEVSVIAERLENHSGVLLNTSV